MTEMPSFDDHMALNSDSRGSREEEGGGCSREEEGGGGRARGEMGGRETSHISPLSAGKRRNPRNNSSEKRSS